MEKKVVKKVPAKKKTAAMKEVELKVKTVAVEAKPEKKRAVKATKTLRVSAEGELEGIDIHEHGAGAYHWDFGAGGSGGGFSQAGIKAAEKTSV